MGKISVLILLIAILVKNGYCLSWYTGDAEIGFIEHSTTSFSSPTSSHSQYSNEAINPSASLFQRTNRFAIDFYEAVTKGQSGNFIMSPISAQTSLSLLYCGASGQTASIMANSLLYNGQTQNQVAQEYQIYLAPLQTQSPIVEMANGLFLTENYEIQPKFLSTARIDFHSNVQTLNFADSSGAAAKINNWVTEETNGKITNLIPAQDLGVDTSMVLVNAISVHGNWQTSFNASQTKPANFYTGNCGNGKVSTVQMMHVESTFNFAFSQYLNAQIIQLPYNGTDISMVIFLPRLCNGLTALEKALSTYSTYQLMIDLYIQSWPQYVNLSLPKFDIKSTLNLKTPLEALRMDHIFTSEANFSNIIKRAIGHPQYIDVSAVVQKAYISVNEQGAAAAAATAPESVFGSTPPPSVKFEANHPFVYALTTPNEILLMGRFVQ